MAGSAARKGAIVRKILAVVYAGVLLVLVVSAGFGTQVVVAQPAPCRFVLGFAELRDLIGPEIVGECLEDQWSTDGGDAVQRTTKGVMGWRRADNVTGFTDGWTAWVNGPQGVQSWPIPATGRP